MSAEENLSLMHDVTYCEAQTMFLDHVRQVVFIDHKIITLQELLSECINIKGVHGLPNTYVSQATLRRYCMVYEFDDGIGYYSPSWKNQNKYCNTSGSSSYIEALRLCWENFERKIQ